MAKRSRKNKPPLRETEPKPRKDTARTDWTRSPWTWGLALALAVVVIYQPAWFAGYIWDDSVLLTANPCIVGPQGLKEIWTTTAADICPLTITTFWIEHAMWGLAPAPYHLVNILLHAGCAVVLWRVLRRLQVPGAWIGAALWAFHPLQVESVAWIAEMKNTESGLFYLLSILFFVRWLETADAKNGPGRDYTLTLLFAAMAMAAKSSTVILPVILVLCAWWKQGRWQIRHAAVVAPIFLMALLATWVSIQTQGVHLANGLDIHTQRGWPERLATAGDATWFYLGKLLWPYPLMTIYPRWQVDASSPISYLSLLAVIFVLVIFWLKRGGWARPWFFAFAYFLIALLPGLGLADNAIFRYSLVFDHFQYLAGMGPLALVGAGLVRLSQRPPISKPVLSATMAAALLLILAAVSWHRASVYQNQETLWTDAIAKNPDCWIGYNNLGQSLEARGQLDTAVADFEKAIALNPNYAEALNNLGNAFQQKGDMANSIAKSRQALAIDPNYAAAHNSLGSALSFNGQSDAAIVEYQQAITLDPELASAHSNLGHELMQKGQTDDALAEYRKALAIDPNLAVAHNQLAAALFQQGRVDEAIAEFRKALATGPDDAEIHNSLGAALFQSGHIDEAIAESQKALAINPSLIEAHANLASDLLQAGRVDEAIAECQKALAINPNMAAAHDTLGLALLQQGRLDEAITEEKKALALNPNAPATHNHLGIALANKGQFDAAIAEYQKALQLAPDTTSLYIDLGVAYARKGQFNEAIQQLQTALRLNPNDSNAQSDLKKVEAMAHQAPAAPH